MDIILIRHGQTEDNLAKVYSKDTTKLSRKGIEQVKAAKEQIEALDFSKVYYSPLTRTKETLEYLTLQGEADARIREIDFGIFAGKTYDILEREYPMEMKAWAEQGNTYEIPNGESMEKVYFRLVEFLDELISQDENVVLITHEGIIRLACCWVLGDINYFYRFKVDNGSVSIITINEGYKYIYKLNSI